jgi:hypothetical protein
MGDQPVAPAHARARTHTHTHTHTQNANRVNAHNTDIHTLSAIRAHDPSVRESEDSSCLRMRGHCDRLRSYMVLVKVKESNLSNYVPIYEILIATKICHFDFK